MLGAHALLALGCSASAARPGAAPAESPQAGSVSAEGSASAAAERTASTPFSSHLVYGLDGSKVHLLEQAAGRIAVIDLWATWCTACERTHPMLEKLAQSYDSKDLYVVGVSVDESAAKVKRYIEAHSYGYPVFLDRKYELSDALGINELPMLYVLDESGQIVRASHELDEEALSWIRSAIEQRK